MSQPNPYEPPPTAGEAVLSTPRGGGRLYHGWMIVLLAAVAMAATLPGRTHGLGLITARLLDDLQLSSIVYAQMNLWATLLGAAFCLPCGWLIDRFGVRSVVTVVLLLLGVVVMWLSLVEHWTALFVALTFTRGLGQSMLSVVSITMVGKWFSRRLSPAMGLYSVLMSILMAGATGMLGKCIIDFGWREAWRYQGLVLVGLSPLMWLLARNAPQDPRLEFDRDAKQGFDNTTTIPGATFWQALATPSFWVFSLSISFFGLISSGLSLFNQYVLAERGFGEEVFHQVLVIGLMVGMTANLIAGFLAKRLPMQRLLSFALLMLATALACFPFIQTLPQVYGYAVVNGVAGGFLTVLFFGVWGHAFGTTQLGRIQAAAQTLTVFASAAGPLSVSISRGYTGSYLQVFGGSAVVAFVFAVVAWFTPVPSARTGAWCKPSAIEEQPETKVSATLENVG
ncbi:MAG: MFS transporter [Pirellulaceae bacterium]